MKELVFPWELQKKKRKEKKEEEKEEERVLQVVGGLLPLFHFPLQPVFR
jgi:hypothetical protein